MTTRLASQCRRGRNPACPVHIQEPEEQEIVVQLPAKHFLIDMWLPETPKATKMLVFCKLTSLVSPACLSSRVPWSQFLRTNSEVGDSGTRDPRSPPSIVHSSSPAAVCVANCRFWQNRMPECRLANSQETVRVPLRMKLLFLLLGHLLVTLARLPSPGGLRSVVAESLAIKHQLLIMKRSPQRASISPRGIGYCLDSIRFWSRRSGCVK